MVTQVRVRLCSCVMPSGKVFVVEGKETQPETAFARAVQHAANAAVNPPRPTLVSVSGQNSTFIERRTSAQVWTTVSSLTTTLKNQCVQTGALEPYLTAHT